MILGSTFCTFFTGSVGTDFSKFFFKIGSHGTIHTLKNYFTTVFSVFSFQFSAISGIQTDSKRNILLIVFLHNKNNRSITCDYALINYKCGWLFIYLFIYSIVTTSKRCII